jgi:hypothetical protein
MIGVFVMCTRREKTKTYDQDGTNVASLDTDMESKLGQTLVEGQLLVSAKNNWKGNMFGAKVNDGASRGRRLLSTSLSPPQIAISF